MSKMEDIAKFNSMYKFLHGSDIDMSDFWQRLKVQKTAYLLRLLGFPFSEKQGWYVRGPYSSSLASLAYEIDEMHEKPVVRLTTAETKKLNALKNNFNEELKNYDKIELLVSVLYVMKKIKKDQTTIIEWIIKNKPWYTKVSIQKMINKVKKHEQIFDRYS